VAVRWYLRFGLSYRDVEELLAERGVEVNETYMKVAGQWRYIYRAIDQLGQVVDVLVCRRRDANAARRFFDQAIGATKVTPVEVTTDEAKVYPGRAGGTAAAGVAPHRSVCQQPGRVRPRSAEGTAATDARAQTGP
jgi:transposase-like protein